VCADLLQVEARRDDGHRTAGTVVARIDDELVRDRLPRYEMIDVTAMPTAASAITIAVI
jgi:hypothetical protein